MKTLITIVLIISALAFTSTALYGQVSFRTGDMYVYVDEYGLINIRTIAGEDTIWHFDRASILASGEQNEVYDYFRDVEIIEESAFIDNSEVADFEVNGLFDNSYSGLPPAFLLDQTTYGWNNAKYILVKYDMTNIGETPLNTSIGLDIVVGVDNTYENDTVLFNETNQVLYMYENTYVGFKILSAQTLTGHVFEWYDGYRDTDTTLFGWLTGGVKDSSIFGTNGNGAVAILGSVPIALNAMDSVDVYIAIALGDNEEEMLANIAAAEAQYNGITSVTRGDLLPKTFSLSQNYPNPFNPATKISFDLPSREAVSFKVFNMLGEEVATLINQEMEAGNYTVDFNAASLSSGMYIYQINAGSFQQTKKMTLVK